MSASMAAKSIGSAISVRNCASTSRGCQRLRRTRRARRIRMAAVYYEGKVDADGHHGRDHAALCATGQAAPTCLAHRAWLGLGLGFEWRTH